MFGRPLSRLEQIDLKDVWSHETSSFTPWLGRLRRTQNEGRDQQGHVDGDLTPSRPPPDHGAVALHKEQDIVSSVSHLSGKRRRPRDHRLRSMVKIVEPIGRLYIRYCETATRGMAGRIPYFAPRVISAVCGFVDSGDI